MECSLACFFEVLAESFGFTNRSAIASAIILEAIAYPLTSDLDRPVKELLQIYFNRWRIEVNHREEKDTLGVG